MHESKPHFRTRFPFTFAGLATAFLTASLSATAAHADPPASRATIVAALSGFERGPDVVTVSSWGAPGAQTLMDVALDAHELPHVRTRAAYSLRLFPQIAAVHD